MTVSLPNTISNDSTRDARPIQANFQAIEDAFNNDYFPRDGSVAMTGDLTLPGAPTADLHAATKAYVDDVIPVGVIHDYAGATAPAGWALCQGQLVDKSANPQLYALIGTTYGAETGSQFRLPDLQSRFVVGKGTATWSDALGEAGGSKDAVVVSHNHTQDPHSHTASSTASGVWMQTGTGNPSGTMASPDYPGANGDQTISVSTTVNAATATNQAAGESGTDKNLPPYITLNKIIRLG